MNIDAGSRDEAVTNLKTAMTQEAFDQHFREWHQPTEQKPTLQQAHANIEQIVRAA